MRNLKTAVVASATTLALGISLATSPTVLAQTESTVNLNMACNLQIKKPSGVTSAAQGVYNSGERGYENFKVDLKANAPASVKAGEEFEYVIDLGRVIVPGAVKTRAIGGAVATVTKVSQLNLWVDLPQNAQVVSIAKSGGDSRVQVDNKNGRLHFHSGGADISSWTTNNRNAWQHGGAEAGKSGGNYYVDMPKVTLKLKATGQPGSEIAPTIRKTDANKFPSDSFVQFYTDASAAGGLSKPNAFIRCGLSTDDTSGYKKKESDSFPAVKIEAPAPKPTPTSEQPKPTSEQPKPSPEQPKPSPEQPKPTAEQPAPSSEQPAPKPTPTPTTSQQTPPTSEQTPPTSEQTPPTSEQTPPTSEQPTPTSEQTPPTSEDESPDPTPGSSAPGGEGSASDLGEQFKNSPWAVAIMLIVGLIVGLAGGVGIAGFMADMFRR